MMRRPETDTERGYRLLNIPPDYWANRVKMIAGEPYRYTAEESREIAQVLNKLGEEMLFRLNLKPKRVKSHVNG